MSQPLSQLLNNPYQTISQLLQNNQVNTLFSFIIQLAQKYHLYISASFEAVYVETRADQQAFIIHAYLPDYIITIIVNAQNKVSFTITPAVNVNCGGK